MIDRLLSPAGAIRAGLFREPFMLVMAWLPMRSPVPAIPNVALARAGRTPDDDRK